MTTETPFFELIEDVTKLALITAFLFLALQVYVRRRSLVWGERFTRRRIAILVVIGLIVVGIKIFEDVLGKESGPIDETILRFIDEHVPTALSHFSIVTLTGSFRVLFPATVVVTIVLAVFRRNFEAVLVAVSMVSAGALIFIIKIVVERARPALWESKDYWGNELSEWPHSRCCGVCNGGINRSDSNLAEEPQTRHYRRKCMGPASWDIALGARCALAN